MVRSVLFFLLLPVEFGATIAYLFLIRWLCRRWRGWWRIVGAIIAIAMFMPSAVFAAIPVVVDWNRPSSNLHAVLSASVWGVAVGGWLLFFGLRLWWSRFGDYARWFKFLWLWRRPDDPPQTSN